MLAPIAFRTMKTLITPLIIFALLSCDKKVTTESTKPDNEPLENIKLEKDSLNNRLLGEWTVRLSCDGSVLCNVCPKISFKADGFGTTTNGVGAVENMKWEIKNDRLKIKNFDNDNIVDDGEYSMTYKTDKDGEELELIDITDSDCYKFDRAKSNRR